jgi:hypothetical protein
VQIPSRDQESFYRSAAFGLRALDATGAQRRYFGSEAEATWSAIVGSLRPSDRLDLLIRNAAVASPAAFAPRVIFPIAGLADDEPFGPEWEAPAALPEQLLREAAQPLADASPKRVLAEAAKAWGLAPKPLPPLLLANLTPASRILAAGAGAILALAEHFQGRAGHDLGGQVVLLTNAPGERQLLGLAAALLGSATTPRFLSPGTTAKAAAELRTPLTAVHLAAVSDDAAPEAAETVAALASELKA